MHAVFQQNSHILILALMLSWVCCIGCDNTDLDSSKHPSGIEEQVNEVNNENNMDTLLLALRSHPYGTALDFDQLEREYGRDLLLQGLRQVLNDEDCFVRYRATFMLFRYRDEPKKRLDSLFESLQSEEKYESGVGWLGYCPFEPELDLEYASHIQQYLISDHAYTRAIAAQALNQFAGESDILEAIIRTANDEDPQVRAAVALALNYAVRENEDLIANTGILETLFQLMKDPEVEVRSGACLALFRHGPEPEILDPLLEATKDEHSSVRVKAYIVLTEVWPPDIILPLMLDALYDPDEFVIQAAVIALGNIGPPASEALPRLRELVELDITNVSSPARKAIIAIEQDD